MAFARFCTEAYEKPNYANMNNVFMHLTNYALNKNSEFYEENDEEFEKGHKRSLGAILRIL
jgi:tubulin polyglutamylase TTLL6/13